MATAQNTAIALANQVLSLGAQLESLLQAVNGIVAQYNDTGVSTIWQAMSTAAKSADGSLGTADGTATSGHPISNAALNQAVAATSLMSAVGIMQDFQTFMNGTGAAPQVNRRQALAQNLVS